MERLTGTCRWCHRRFTYIRLRSPRKYCSDPCRSAFYNKRRLALYAEHRDTAHQLLHRTDPKVVRALVLTRWPDLRTAEEQEALDRWLAVRAEGVADALLEEIEWGKRLG